MQLLLCGLPLFYMELALGQFHQTGLFTLWEKICPILKGLAFTTLIINLFMAMFYNTVIAWSVYYLFLSFKSVVPWKDCDNSWNTYCCFPINDLNKIPIVRKNLLLQTEKYQKIYDNGLIYRNFKRSNNINRVVMFDTRSQNEKTENNSVTLFFEGISKLFGITDLKSSDYQSTSSSSNDTLEIDNKITSILKSFFIVQNNQLKESLNASFLKSIPNQMIKRYHHDPSLLIQKIEDEIDYLYGNKSASIVLNCGELMSNPTQEFFNRYLTEMHKSTGIESFGNIKWELVVCLIVVFTTVYFALWKGIKSAGKVMISI